MSNGCTCTPCCSRLALNAHNYCCRCFHADFTAVGHPWSSHAHSCHRLGKCGSCCYYWGPRSGCQVWLVLPHCHLRINSVCCQTQSCTFGCSLAQGQMGLSGLCSSLVAECCSLACRSCCFCTLPGHCLYSGGCYL